MNSSPQPNLPSDIKDYLLSSEITKRNGQIIDKYKFGGEEQKKYFKMILKIFLKELFFSSLPAVIMSDLKIDDDKVIKELMQDIKEIVLSPVKEYLGLDADGKQRGYEQNILIDKAVKKFNLFAVPHPTSILPSKEREEAELKKFMEIADTFLSNVRTKTQFKNTLVKPVADGGLGMEHDLADDVAEFLASYSRLQPIIARAPRSPKGEVGKSEAMEQARPSVIARSPRRSNLVLDGEIATPSEGFAMTQEAKPVPPNVKIEVNFEKEEKEAKNIEPKIAKMRVAAPKLLSVTEGVQKALAELNYTFPSSELQERLKSVIDARVRNVRTSLQTFDKLTQDIPSGGLGFSKLEADRVSLVLNKYLEEKNKDIYGSKLAEIKQAEDEEKKKSEERTLAAEEAERKNFDERFTKLTGKTPPPVIASEARQSPPALTKKEIEEKKNDELRITNYELRKEKEPVIARSEVKRSDAAIPSTTRSPRPSVASGLAMTPKERPVLEDIKYTPKLAGPTEEIARLTLEDFRKLSGDPKEAVLKIKDKLALLREESYKKYQTGVDAWYRSPLYGEYIKAMSQSLTAGASLGDVLKGGQTLTQEEFDAIINNKMGD